MATRLSFREVKAFPFAITRNVDNISLGFRFYLILRLGRCYVKGNCMGWYCGGRKRMRTDFI